LRFDLLIHGGDVVDVHARTTSRLDVGISGGRVAAVAAGLAVADARTTIDATGLLVTPGLVDMHTHVYRGASYYGLDPDTIAWRSGVTTWVDAGSAGAYGLDGLRAYAATRAVRIKALLNVSGIGLVGPSYECRVLENCDVPDAAAVLTASRDLVVGVKARIDANACGHHGLEVLRRARQLADECEVPLMVHLGAAPPTVPEILGQLRAGDVATHCASGVTTGMLTADGRVSSAALEAHERGVVFDLGHGVGGFSFEVAEALLAAGCGPDVISTDLHARSVHGPAYDLPTVIAKVHALGVPLPAAIAAASVRPAQVLGLPAGTGTLDVGVAADVALFAVETGTVVVSDVHGSLRSTDRRLINTRTIVAGRVLRPVAAEAPLPWIRLPDGLSADAATDAAAVRAVQQPALERLARPGDYPIPASRGTR
jgi:dihydroorotase